MAESKLIQYVQDFAWEKQTAETQRLTKRAVLDLLGCALSGSTHATVPQVATMIEDIAGGGAESIWGTNGGLTVAGAVFMNAYTGAIFDMDDGHRRAQGHPGAIIVPAALTFAGKNKNTGKEFLEAVAVGYDVSIREAVRIREAGGPRKGTSGWAAPGAAVAVGRLLKLDAEKMANALGLSEYFTPQAGQDRSVAFPSMMKEGICWGAYTGTFCAQLASGGFTAMRPNLCDSEELNSDLGERVEIDYTYYKKWSACRWAHPALAGLEQMKAEQDFTIKDIQKVELRSFKNGLNLSNRRPDSALKAVYSIPFSLAYWCKHGKIEPDDLKDEQRMVSDPDITEMADKIEMVEAPEYSAEFPLKCIQDITVTFMDGTVRTKTGLEAPWDCGDRAPSDEEIEAKFRTLAEPVVGARWQQIVDCVKRLDQVADLGELIALMRT